MRACDHLGFSHARGVHLNGIMMTMLLDLLLSKFEVIVQSREEYAYFFGGYIWFYNLTVREGLIYCLCLYIMV
jgi:hypothetical protein